MHLRFDAAPAVASAPVSPEGAAQVPLGIGAAMLSGIPLAFTFGFDPCAVDKEVQWAGPTAIRQAHVQHSLTATQRTQVGGRPIQTDQLQKTFDEPRHLPQGHTKQHFQGQTSLDRRIAELLLSTTLAGWWWPSCHPGIEPNRQRSTLLQRLIVSRPVRGLVSCGMPTTHNFQLSCWFHAVNPSTDLCNKALHLL